MSRLLLGTLGPLAVFCGGVLAIVLRLSPPADPLDWVGAAGLAAAGCLAVGWAWSRRAALLTLTGCLAVALWLLVWP